MKPVLIFTILALFSLANCTGGDGSDGSGILSLTNDREKAIGLIDDANSDLKRIRVLYRENNSKIKELKDALGSNEVTKVKRMSDDLLLVILDGYALAESAQEKIVEAQRLDIHADFKYYLRLKEESLTQQIKAFDFRRESAILFRDKFGTDNKSAMAEAAKKFKENEANFEKTMAEATKVSKQADQVYKQSNNQNR